MIYCKSSYSCHLNNIVVVIVSVLASRAVDRGFEPSSGKIKDYKIGFCSFSAKHASIRSNNKDWLARNQNNLSEWNDIFTRRLSGFSELAL